MGSHSIQATIILCPGEFIFKAVTWKLQRCSQLHGLLGRLCPSVSPYLRYLICGSDVPINLNCRARSQLQDVYPSSRVTFPWRGRHTPAKARIVGPRRLACRSAGVILHNKYVSITRSSDLWCFSRPERYAHTMAILRQDLASQLEGLFVVVDLHTKLTDRQHKDLLRQYWFDYTIGVCHSSWGSGFLLASVVCQRERSLFYSSTHLLTRLFIIV